MQDPRIGAAAIAVFLIILATAVVSVKRRLIAVTLVGLLFGIPVVGLGAYIVRPSSVSGGRPFAWAALIATLLAIGAAVGASSSPNVPQRRKAYFYLLTLGAGVIATASLLALWQPIYSVGEIVLTALWALAWLPASRRSTDVQVSTQISAPRSTVFKFVSDPLNWASYQRSGQTLYVLNLQDLLRRAVASRSFV